MPTIVRLAVAAAALALAVLVLSWRSDDRACESAGREVLLNARTGGAGLREALREVRERCHGVDALVASSTVLLRNGRSAAAASSAREAVRRQPEEFAAWAALTVALAEDDAAGSAAARRRALELNPLAAPRRGPGRPAAESEG